MSFDRPPDFSGLGLIGMAALAFIGMIACCCGSAIFGLFMADQGRLHRR